MLRFLLIWFCYTRPALLHYGVAVILVRLVIVDIEKMLTHVIVD